MQTTLEYLLRMERFLFDNQYTADCTCLAYEVAKRLLDEEKMPALYRIGDQRFPRVVFAPLRFPEKIWLYHDVCMVDGVVWDPMMGQPLLLDEYFTKAFGASLQIEERVSATMLQRYLSSWRPTHWRPP